MLEVPRGLRQDCTCKGSAENQGMGTRAAECASTRGNCFGLQTGRIFAGSIVIETLFGIPGMGQFMGQAIFARDFQAVQGSILIMAMAVLLANLITDFVYAWLDPRIRYND